MITFTEHMAFVCFAVVAIGLFFAMIAGIFYLIDYLTRGKFSEAIIRFLKK